MEEIKKLRTSGLSITAISQMTGYDRKTIRKHLLNATSKREYGPRPPRSGKLDNFKPYIQERLQAGVWNAVVLLREIRERGYAGGYGTVKEYLQPQREAARTVAPWALTMMAPLWAAAAEAVNNSAEAKNSDFIGISSGRDLS